MANLNEYKILIVDDEEDIVEFLSYNIQKEGYRVFGARNGLSAIELARKELPHLILMDVMMPEMDGIETCEELRKIAALNNTIIAFLTARGEDYSQIAGFEAGGDDYITKPIKPKVLISRIKALLKRVKDIEVNAGAEPAELIIERDGLIINREKYMVYKNGEELVLPKKEFELLALLINKPGKVFSRDEIFNTIWGEDIIVGDRTIDVHIRKLREKIGEERIETVKGVGYRYTEK
ncbi:MAG: response regulator transcription factor [Bacteroidales bacterium]|nr:response regulator transcription factor [Bacteroidales bacterium]